MTSQSVPQTTAGLDGHSHDSMSNGQRLVDLDGQAPASSDGRGSAGWLAQLSDNDLRRLAVTMPVIEQAKGVLMGLYSVSADTAYAVLKRWSQQHNVKVHTLSAEIVKAAATPAAEPFGVVREFCQSL